MRSRILGVTLPGEYQGEPELETAESGEEWDVEYEVDVFDDESESGTGPDESERVEILALFIADVRRAAGVPVIASDIDSQALRWHKALWDVPLEEIERDDEASLRSEMERARKCLLSDVVRLWNARQGNSAQIQATRDAMHADEEKLAQFVPGPGFARLLALGAELGYVPREGAQAPRLRGAGGSA